MTVGQVVIVGGGVPAALTALALRRAFEKNGLNVHWVETPAETSPHAALASLPNLQSFHQLLGISEAELLRATSGTYTLGQQYVGFTGETSAFLHCYGPAGPPIGSLPFMQFWIKAKAAGLPAAFGDFCRDSVAAYNGRIQLSEAGRPPATAHGYNLDHRAYFALLRTHAARSGVSITPDIAPHPIVSDGRVSAICLADGTTIKGDLFVDATGEHAMVMRALSDERAHDAIMTGCNRVMLATGAALRPIPLFSRVTAHPAGWSAVYPLQDRLAIVAIYDSAQMSDDAAVANAGPPLIDSAEFFPLAARSCTRPWVSNAIAIGNALSVPELLGSTMLHGLQIAITHLVSLFPVSADTVIESRIYNDEIASYQARLRDFHMTHFHLNQREEAFWVSARNQMISTELRAKIDLFLARGMIAQYNHESFAEEEWIALFLGHGLVPRSYDPQVDRVPEQQVMTDFQRQLAAIRAEVSAMDTHDAALAKAMRG